MKSNGSVSRSLFAAFLVAALVMTTGCGLLAPRNAPPRLVVNAQPTEGRAPLIVRFDAGSSTDDGSIVEISWTFGDEGRLTGWQVERTFTRPGRHEVHVTARDDAGAKSETVIEIVVHNSPPYASGRFSNDAPNVGERVQFDASSSFDPDGAIVDFVWDFGDGTSARGTRVSHVYGEVGAYIVRLTVVDDAGAIDELTHLFTVHLATAGGGCGGR